MNDAKVKKEKVSLSLSKLGNIVPPAPKKAATYCANKYYGHHYANIEPPSWWACSISQPVPNDLNAPKPFPKLCRTLSCCIWMQIQNKEDA